MRRCNGPSRASWPRAVMRSSPRRTGWRRSPGVLARRVVFVTGFATDRTTEEFLKATGQPYLAKPFETEALLDAVERVSRGPEAP